VKPVNPLLSPSSDAAMRMWFAVLSDRPSGAPYSGVLLWSLRSSTELERKGRICSNPIRFATHSP
jgi:hypothetical protein